MIAVYDSLRNPVRRSKNLRALLEAYRAYPDSLVVKVRHTSERREPYEVTFFWPNARLEATTYWGDWRVLLDWLHARRSWDVDRITFDAPLYDVIAIEAKRRFERARKAGTYVTRHAYQS